MAVLVERRSRPVFNRGRQPSCVSEYKVWREERTTLTSDDAYYYFINSIPPVEKSLLLNDAKITSTKSPFLYYGTATYRVDPIPSENAPLRWNGTTRGGKARVFRSLQTVQAWTRPATLDGSGNPLTFKAARDLNGAIEVDEDNNVQGTDVAAPNEEWTLTAYVKADLFTRAYRRRLRQYSPCINSAAWQDFKPYEVLFLGADWDYTLEATDVTAGDRVSQLVQLTFYFKAGYNETNLVIGDLGAKDESNQPVPIFKRAHDHLWYEWEESIDETTGLLTRRPSVARLERLYEARPFSQLGLGGDVNPPLPEES